MNAVISDNLYELNIPIEIKSPNPNETFSVTAYHTFAKTLSNTGISFEDIQDTLKVVIPADQDSISIEVVQMVNEVAKKDTILRASVKDNLCKVRISTHTNETKIHLLHVSADTFLSERTEF
jgi:ribosomal protein L28